MNNEEEIQDGYLVYAGPDIQGKEWVHVYYKFLDISRNNGLSAESDLSIFTFDKPPFKRVGIGGVVQCKFVGNVSIRYDADRYPCATWKCEEDRVKWYAKRSAYDQHEQVMKGVKQNDLIERLKPIREAYKESSWHNQRAILAEVMRIITT